MADVELIIKIPEDKYELLQCSVTSGLGDWVHKIVAQGIPLEEHCDSCVFYHEEGEEE